MCTLCICFYEELLLEKTYKQTHTKKKNNKTKKQHVHQQKNLTTALAKNKSVMELSLQLAGQFQRTFKRRVSYIQDGCRLFYKRNKKINEISLNSLLLYLYLKVVEGNSSPHTCSGEI